GLGSNRQLFQKALRTSEPRALAAPQITWQSGFFGQDALRPLAGFGIAALGAQEFCVIQIGFRERGDLYGLAEQRVSSLGISSLRIRMCKQARPAVEIILGVLVNDPFKISDGSRKILQLDFADASPIERIGGIGAR